MMTQQQVIDLATRAGFMVGRGSIALTKYEKLVALATALERERIAKHLEAKTDAVSANACASEIRGGV